MHSGSQGADLGRPLNSAGLGGSLVQRNARTAMAKANPVQPMHAIAAERVENKVFKYVSENRVRAPPLQARASGPSLQV